MPTGALSRLTDAGRLDRAPVGIFRQVERPAYDDLARGQVSTAQQAQGSGDLAALLRGSDTWTVGLQPGS
jgi:2-oxoglutarate ferredoxin oxidoreductase subunit beta